MSSSRRRSRNRASERTGRCPTCGSNRVVQVVEEVALRVGRRTHRFERVPHERCQACGERVFGIEASRRFDAVVLKRGRHAA